jgi:hypothetical protein
MNSHQVANNNNSFREEPAFTGLRGIEPRALRPYRTK